jgi:hypothetical protein
MNAADGGAVRAFVDLFVERIQLPPVEKVSALRRAVLLVTVDDQTERLAGLCSAIEAEGISAELASIGGIHDFMNPDDVALIVDQACDGPYRELTISELTKRFPGARFLVVDISGAEPQQGVISLALPARRFGRATGRQFAGAARPLIAELQGAA